MKLSNLFRLVALLTALSLVPTAWASCGCGGGDAGGADSGQSSDAQDIREANPDRE